MILITVTTGQRALVKTNRPHKFKRKINNIPLYNVDILEDSKFTSIRFICAVAPIKDQNSTMVTTIIAYKGNCFENYLFLWCCEIGRVSSCIIKTIILQSQLFLIEMVLLEL